MGFSERQDNYEKNTVIHKNNWLMRFIYPKTQYATMKRMLIYLILKLLCHLQIFLMFLLIICWEGQL